MSVIGIIYTAFQTEEYLDMSLSPWVAARAARVGGYDYLICAVSVPFEGFNQDGIEPDRTRAMLGTAAHHGEIDHVIVSDKPMRETEARGAALKWLMDKGATMTWQHDSDEIITTNQIARIVAFVEASPWMMSYRLSLRNAVFDEHSYLAEPFQPMRIHRTHGPGGHVADGFWDDNNVRYTRPWEREKMSCPVVRDIQMASMTIPPNVAWLIHLSWLSNLRSKRKIEYQTARGWECSFRWDEVANELRFNEAYYERRGECLPEVLRD